MASERRQGYAYADLYVGMSFRSPGRTITDADLVAFAGLTGDYSELHTSDVYAKNSEFGRRVAHGMLGLAYAHGLMWARTGELRDTAIAFLGIGEWKFLQPIFIGDTIFVTIGSPSFATASRTRAIATFDVELVARAIRSSSRAQALLVPGPFSRWASRG
jgi:acyl dehydratase